jgi:hypothetical protein
LVRREVLYNILIQFEALMKIVRLAKMCLNETYSKVHTILVCYVSYPKWSKTRRCFNTIAFPTLFSNMPLGKFRKTRWVKGKAIPVTGRGDPQGCETFRFAHFLDSWLTDGSDVISLPCHPPFAQGRFLVLISSRCGRKD